MSSSRDGDVDLNFMDGANAACPQPLYKKLRSRCPVGRPIPEGPICLSKYEDVLFALRHPEIFSSAMPVGLIGNKRPLIPLQIDPPQQVKYRKILDPIFSHRNMLKLEADTRKLAADLIDRFADQDEIEFNKAFAVPYPCEVFLKIMGLPLSDLDLFLELKDGIVRPDPEAGDPLVVRNQTGQRIYEYFERVIPQRRSEIKDDLIGHFMQAEVDGEKLSDEEIIDIVFLFLLAGLDTVTATLGCNIANLAQNAERRQALVDEPALIPSAVEELLRWETPVVQVIRMLLQDHTIGGVDLKAGDAVVLNLGSANTDEDMFDDADCVLLDRELNKHLAFGGGVHRCLGSHLARMELEVALEEFHKRIPVYSIKPGEQPIYSPGIREVTYLPLVFRE